MILAIFMKNKNTYSKHFCSQYSLILFKDWVSKVSQLDQNFQTVQIALGNLLNFS